MERLSKKADCDVHEQKIHDIQTEFTQYKQATELKFDRINDLLGEIKEEIKPQFSYAQITGFVITLLGYMVGVMLFVGDLKSDIRDNSTNIKYIGNASEKTTLQYENIMQSINQTQREVSELKVEVKNLKK